jgi:hypothetical protein
MEDEVVPLGDRSAALAGNPLHREARRPFGGAGWENAGSDQLVETQAGAKIHDRAYRQMDFARNRRDVVYVPPREIADKPKHPAPFVAVAAALPLVAQSYSRRVGRCRII